MLYRPLLHSTYIEDIFFGVIFVVMLSVFLYFYFSDKGEPDLEGNGEDPKKRTPSDATAQSREEKSPKKGMSSEDAPFGPDY